MGYMFRTSLILASLLPLSGCMDGPFYTMKRINPYFQAQWRADRKHGPTFGDRLQELRELESRVDSMDASEQTQVAEKLAKIVSEDPSPDIRATAIRSVAKLSAPSVTKALNMASVDEVEKVRLAACEAWRIRGGSDAQDMLMSMATADESNSVRQSAIECLAEFEDTTVMRTLANLLDDRSPAITYRAAQSLAQLSGQDFGGDFEQWKDYVASVSPTSDVPGSVPDLGKPAVQTVNHEVDLPPIPGMSGNQP